MLAGYVARQMRRSTRNLLLINLALALIAVGIPLAGWSYIAECLGGPFDMTVQDVMRLPDEGHAPHRFVRVNIDADQLDNTGYKITGGDSHKNDYYHFLHVSETKVLIIKAHSDELPETLEGSIEGLSGDVTDKVLPAVRGEIKFTSTLPVMLDLSSYRAGMYVMFGICVPLLGLAAWNIWKALARLADPMRHPIARRLAAFGPVEEMAIALDAELQAGADRVGKVITTQSWLLRPFFIGVHIVYLGDVVWAYKKETQIKSYGITTGRTYATVIHDKHGKRLEFQLNQKQVDALVVQLAQRVPWAFVGFDQRMSAAWTKQRGEVIASVEQRKQEYLSGANNPPPVQSGNAPTS